MGSNSLPFGLISGEYSRSEQYEWQQLTLRQREQATREQPHHGANLNYPVHTPSRTEKSSPSFGCVCDYSKGADGHIHATVSLGKVLTFNWGSSTQNRHYQKYRCLPTDFPGGHFSEIDEARHRSYMDSFHTENKPDHISAGRWRRRDEVSRAHTNKKPSDELHPIHPEQLELSPSKDFHGYLDISRNCRIAYSGKTLRTKWTKWSFQKNNSSGACVIRHGRNNRQRRYGDQLSGQKAKKSRQKRYGDQLAGQKAKKHMAYKEQPKGFCSLIEQDQQPYLHREVDRGGSDVMKNGNQEGNAETTKEVGHNGAKRNCHPKKNILTDVTCCGSAKSNENSDVLSPNYSGKTIASSNGPKQSEGSSNMKLESDKRPSVVGCTKRPRNTRTEEVLTCNPQHLPVTHMEKAIHTIESDNTSPSELLRDCLTLWRRRRLRKASGVEAEQIVQTDKIVTLRNGRSAASGSSESDDENVSASESASDSSESADANGTALENSKKCLSAMSPNGIQKRDERRVKKKSKQPFICLSGDNCNKSSQNRMAKQGLKCNVEVLPEANLGEIIQQKEKSATSPNGIQKHDERRVKRMSEQPLRCLGGGNCNKSSQNRMAKQGLKCNVEVLPEANLGEIMQQKEKHKLPCRLLSTAHTDTMIQNSQNSCSDTSKVDQAAASHSDSNVCQKVSLHEEINDHLDARKKNKLGISCETKKKAEGDGAKWCEQMTSLSTDLTPLDQNTVALGSLHDGNVKVYGSGCSNQKSKASPSFSASELDEGAANNCPNKPVNWSSRSDCRDILGDTMNCNILRNEQVSSALAHTETNVRHFDTDEDYQPAQALEGTSNQQISQQSDSDRKYSDVARPADQTSGFGIPDLNCLPSMITDEEEFKASEEVIYQVTGDGSKQRNAGQSFSAPFSGPTVQEEQFKQPEPNESIGGVCEREVASRSQISDSHSVPRQLSTVEESSTSTLAFKCALGEFIKNILRSLWEDGVLSRNVHKIIVKKAVEKVTITLGPKVPRTEIAISRFLAEESQSVEKLVQGYLDVYLGRQVLKRIMPDNI